MSLTRKLFLFLGLPLVLAFAVVVAWAFQSKNPDTATDSTEADQAVVACDQMQSPVDVSLATAVLYPGQTRGGDYKPHGGFRFDNSQNNDITVTAPYDASVASASRYIEQGEIQYLVEFRTSCGLDFRFDHLKTLSPKLQAMIEQLPAAKADDSRTSAPKSAVDVTAGETIATAVGFATGPNVSVDFGVYDKPFQNKASQDPAWAALHADEKDQAYYAVCWFDLLPEADAAIVKALPAGDGAAGKTSDYCL
ncbi:MAG: hypothetical protein WEC83_02065 [Patescibacteria group bacterium]